MFLKDTVRNTIVVSTIVVIHLANLNLILTNFSKMTEDLLMNKQMIKRIKMKQRLRTQKIKSYRNIHLKKLMMNTKRANIIHR